MIDHRKLTIGHCTFVWGSLVMWKSKKQNIVVRSSAEAEFRAVAPGLCEGLWLRKLMEKLHVTIKFPIKLYYDIKAAINISLNPT